jgi:uncharacterized lipoprotein NlpE involved in copper resistance
MLATSSTNKFGGDESTFNLSEELANFNADGVASKLSLTPKEMEKKLNSKIAFCDCKSGLT